jgi:glyoxylase-like metal-dependent hydrolase (beta-lactamase superfamily II)
MQSVSRRHFLSLLGAIGVVAPLTQSGLDRFVSSAPTLSQGGGTIGQVVIMRRGPVTLHSYVAPEAGFQVTGHVIELPKQLVVVDTQFAQSLAADFRNYVNSLKKPIERVILSHEHPDHWGGNEQFADLPFVSTATIAKNVKASLDGGSVKTLEGMLGKDAPAKPRVPEAKISAGDETIDGVQFSYDIRLNAEAPEQIVIKLPETKTLIVQDLLYTNAHFFPGIDRAGWIKQLESLRTMQGYDLLLVGHGLPAALGELDRGIEYLTFVNETIPKVANAEELTAALVKRYPTYGVRGILSFWGQFFPKK